MAEKKYFTKKEAAEILGVHARTVERYLLTGKMKGARLGRGWKISEEDICDFYETAKSETVEKIKQRQIGGDIFDK